VCRLRSLAIGTQATQLRRRVSAETMTANCMANTAAHFSSICEHRLAV
jgi:hypothetical protein